MERGQTLGGMESHPARFRSKGVLRQFRGQEETVITHYYTLGKCNALDFASKARAFSWRHENVAPRGTGVKPLWELPRPVVPARQYSVKKAGSRGERKTSRPPARVLYWQTERGYAARHTLFFISASDETTPRRRSGPALPRPAPHYNAPAAVARLRSLWSLVLTERNLGPSKCACGRGPRGHKVRPGLPAVSAVRTPGRAGVRACSAPRCGAP